MAPQKRRRKRPPGELTTTEFAERLGVTSGTVLRWAHAAIATLEDGREPTTRPRLLASEVRRTAVGFIFVAEGAVDRVLAETGAHTPGSR